MRVSRFRLGLLGLTTAAVLLVAAAERGGSIPAPDSKNRGLPRGVELRGRVVCLPEEMHRLYATDLPSQHEHVYGFRATNGVYYTLLRTKWSEGLFVDARLREKELILVGQVLPKTQLFDLSAMRSVKNGAVYDLYYYCDICAIKTLSPGPCMCCQGPVRLEESPLSE
jgi:hypothetical protein